MGIWLRHRPANIEGDWITWLLPPTSTPDDEFTGETVCVRFVTDYGKGERELEVSIEPDRFAWLAGFMMYVDADKATAAFAAALSKQYPVDEDDESTPDQDGSE